MKSFETRVVKMENDQQEEHILQESIVSAAGLSSEQVATGIKGHPSIRKSAMTVKLPPFLIS